MQCRAALYCCEEVDDSDRGPGVQHVNRRENHWMGIEKVELYFSTKANFDLKY